MESTVEQSLIQSSSKMTQDNVNRLPIEILCNVFDLLSFEEQQTAVLTCVRWSNILNSERYLMQRRVKIDLDMIADSADAEALLRYRSFSVADDKIAVDDDLKTMLEFLKEQVAEHAEELRFDLSRYTWPEFFTPEDKSYFPRLKKFSLETRTYKKAECDQVHKRLVAPELKEMLFKTVDESIVQLVQLFSEQLELLDTTYIDTKYFPAILGNCKFEALRRLKISCLQGQGFRLDLQTDNLEFNSTQKDILARLTSLELYNWVKVSRKSILQAACNLETLIIKDSYLSESQFSIIAKMIGLKELCLMIYTGKWISTAEKLALPHLEKLTIFSGTLVPLGNVPRLRQLIIGNDDSVNGGGDLDKMQIEAFFKKCNRQVERLTFSNMFLKTCFIDQICTMSNLRSLELHEVVMKLDDVRKVCQSANRREQIIHFECCVIAHEITSYEDCQYDSDYFEAMVEEYLYAESLESADVFFRELIPQYPDYRISQILCRKVQLIEEWEHCEYIDLARFNLEYSSDSCDSE